MMLKKRFTNLNVEEKIQKLEKIVGDKKVIYAICKWKSKSYENMYNKYQVFLVANLARPSENNIIQLDI